MNRRHYELSHRPPSDLPIVLFAINGCNQAISLKTSCQGSCLTVATSSDSMTCKVKYWLLLLGVLWRRSFRGQECPRDTLPEKVGLRARCKSPDVCHGQPQILVGIHRGVVDADFVVEMRPCRAAA